MRSESSSTLIALNDSSNPSQKKESTKTVQTAIDQKLHESISVPNDLTNTQQVVRTSNIETKELSIYSNKGYLSPCSDSNDSLFTFNAQNKNIDSNITDTASKSESDSDSKLADINNHTDQTLDLESVKLDEDETILNKSISVKRSHSPVSNMDQIPCKKAKDVCYYLYTTFKSRDLVQHEHV